MATKEMIEAAMQEAKDAKDQGKLDDAYTKSLRVTEYTTDKKDARSGVRGQKGYAKGGVTRADGCCTKGKTRGKMV